MQGASFLSHLAQGLNTQLGQLHFDPSLQSLMPHEFTEQQEQAVGAHGLARSSRTTVSSKKQSRSAFGSKTPRFESMEVSRAPSAGYYQVNFPAPAHRKGDPCFESKVGRSSFLREEKAMKARTPGPGAYSCNHNATSKSRTVPTLHAWTSGPVRDVGWESSPTRALDKSPAYVAEEPASLEVVSYECALEGGSASLPIASVSPSCNSSKQAGIPTSARQASLTPETSLQVDIHLGQVDMSSPMCRSNVVPSPSIPSASFLSNTCRNIALTSHGPGPGHYNRRDSPFEGDVSKQRIDDRETNWSTALRPKAFAMHACSEVPGPGTYNAGLPKFEPRKALARNVDVLTFCTFSTRLNDLVADSPGPGAYDCTSHRPNSSMANTNPNTGFGCASDRFESLTCPASKHFGLDGPTARKKPGKHQRSRDKPTDVHCRSPSSARKSKSLGQRGVRNRPLKEAFLSTRDRFKSSENACSTIMPVPGPGAYFPKDIGLPSGVVHTFSIQTPRGQPFEDWEEALEYNSAWCSDLAVDGHS